MLALPGLLVYFMTGQDKSTPSSVSPSWIFYEPYNYKPETFLGGFYEKLRQCYSGVGE